MIPERERLFVESRRIGHLATSEASGMPHLVPVCFALIGDSLYVTIDEKPKRRDRPLKRVRNILDNPQAAFVTDRYDEDWNRLGWVMLRGRAEILDAGAAHDAAQTELRKRYPQYRTMHLADLPVIALRITRVTSWGDLSVD